MNQNDDIGRIPRASQWNESARDDLRAIIDYVSDANPDAAERLQNDIESKVAKLSENPKLYRAGRIPGTREMVVRSNYVVVYAEDEGVVRILRVLHAAQKWPPV